MQPVVGNAHRLGGAGNIELGKHHFHPVFEIGTDQAAVAALEETLEPAMAEALYHSLAVMCQLTLVNNALRKARRDLLGF